MFNRGFKKKFHFTGQILSTVCSILPILQHLQCAYNPQASALVERTNGIIKIQLAKLVQVFNLPWAQLLPIVLINLRSTPFGRHKLSPFKIVTGHPIMLYSCVYASLLAKGHMQSQCKGSIEALKKNSQLVLQSFHSSSLETKTCSTTTYILEILSIRKDILIKVLRNLSERDLTRCF